MTRTKKPKSKKRKAGAIGKYKDDYLHQVEYLSMLGATNQQLADFFKVDVTTISKWDQSKKGFREARKRGGLVADMKVAQMMFKRATGYDFIEEEVRVMQGALITIKVRKHIIPDTTAQIFWLKNRQREQWADVNRMSHEHSGSINHIHEVEDLDVDDMSPEHQEFLFQIGKKQLTDGSRDN